MKLVLSILKPTTRDYAERIEQKSNTLENIGFPQILSFLFKDYRGNASIVDQDQ